MRRLSLGPAGPLGILAIGAHADDIEIGAGGAILRLLEEHPASSIQWVVASATPDRASEARASAGAFSAAATVVDVVVGDLPDGRLPAVLGAVKDLLEPLKSLSIDVVIAPHVGDSHQDHRTVAEVVWQTFRRHLVLEYEIPKYDGDLGKPNLFVAVDEATLRRKIDLLEAHYPSQRDRTWWGADTVRSIARLRGIEAGTRYAEGFHSRKLVL